MSERAPWKASRKRAPEQERLIGQVLRQLRERHSYAVTDMAAALGVTHQAYQSYEAGRNRIALSTAMALCGFLGEPLSEFERLVRAAQPSVSDSAQHLEGKS
ncbi:MAG: XRE family transcriptional regulator [Caulobacteraceae bacterium]|nr:XRE family transcriptional regulator [Caulobacteraceae bacterium]